MILSAEESPRDFRRLCRDDYVDMARRRGLVAVVDDAAECEEAAAVLETSRIEAVRVRAPFARLRAEVAREVAAMPDWELAGRQRHQAAVRATWKTAQRNRHTTKGRRCRTPLLTVLLADETLL